MEILRTSLADVRVITPFHHYDARGSFCEVWRDDILESSGVKARFVQENHVVTKAPGTLRGMHFQIGDSAQGKLVRCVKGRILDVAVDIRRGSPTFGRHVVLELSAENWKQLYVPVGFAHGYCTLEPDTNVIYKVTTYYDALAERGFRWNDPHVSVAWPIKEDAVLVSDKDAKLPLLGELPDYFSYSKDMS
jgi:dTDP-4-dehydrorhamnose 3,5-epimerase